MPAQRRGAVPGARLLVALAQSREHVSQELETRRQRQLALRLLALTDVDHSTGKPLGFIERAFRDPNLDETREDRRRLRMVAAQRGLLQQQQALEQRTGSRVVVSLERDAREAVEADDDVGVLRAQAALGDREGALEQRFRRIHIAAGVAHRGESVHRLHETRMIVAERRLADLEGASEETLRLIDDSADAA